MRQPRVIKTGAIYNVTSRTNRKELIMQHDQGKELFLAILERAKKKYDFQILNFCIMGNHFHLLIKPGKSESLSRIMQWILSVFASAYNRKNDLTGHVWGERFFSHIVSGLQEFCKTFMYIDENPVKAKLVVQAQDWLFGGLWHHKIGRSTIVEEASALILEYFPEHMANNAGV
jgi:putative transposase